MTTEEKTCPFCDAKQHRYLPVFLCGTSWPDSEGEYSVGGKCNERCFTKALIRYDDAVSKVLQGMDEAWNARGASREQLHEWGKILMAARDGSKKMIGAPE